MEFQSNQVFAQLSAQKALHSAINSRFSLLEKKYWAKVTGLQSESHYFLVTMC